MPSSTRKAAAGGLAFVLAGAVLGTTSGTTLAAYSDFSEHPAKVGAGVWAPDPPAACDGIYDPMHPNVVWGTPGDDGPQTTLGCIGS